MNHIKLGAVILILTAGLAGGYLIIKNSKSAGSNGYVTIESSGKAPENSPKPPIQWVEKAREFISHPIEELKKFSDKTVSEPAEEAGLSNSPLNLTDFVAKSVSGQMQYLSQSGEDFDPNDPKNQEAIEKAMADLSSASLFDETTINDKDLKISQDNSAEAQTVYVEKVIKIRNRPELGPEVFLNVLKETFEKNNIKIAKQFALANGNAANEYLDLTIPSEWLDIHKKLISYFKTWQEIYLVIADYYNDPIKASKALEVIDQLLIDNENIRNLFIQKAKNIGL